jgi:hypothetical protein
VSVAAAHVTLFAMTLLVQQLSAPPGALLQPVPPHCPQLAAQQTCTTAETRRQKTRVGRGSAGGPPKAAPG